MKFRKKPVVIDAIQYTGDNHKEILDFVNGCSRAVTWGRTGETHSLVIHTLEGDMYANPMDWIIKGVHGELYPCKPDIFSETYEAVNPVLYREGFDEEDGITWPI